MKLLLPAAASALALTAGACSAPTDTAVFTGRLDCPQSVGQLTRASAAADGKSCLYHEADGAEVTLKLIPVTGGVEATLGTIEAELKAEAGSPAPKTSSATGAKGAEAEAAKVEAEAAADAKTDERSEGSQGKDGDGAKVSVDHHGVTVVEGKDGESTHVNLPGIHISADGDDANVQVGPIHVNAEDGSAVVKIMKDVRMRGEALSRQKRGVRATFIYAGDSLTGGYKFVGYEASGLRTGPLAVAVVKAKSDAASEHHEIYSDVKKLVRRNGGA